MRAFLKRIFGIFRRRTAAPRAVRGRAGERAAAALLRKKGFKILARNARFGRDELDIVARDGEVLVFVEVRARDSHALVSGYHSLTRRKRAAFARGARAYLRALGRNAPRAWRFDVVEVRLGEGETIAEIYHYANVRL